MEELLKNLASGPTDRTIVVLPNRFACRRLSLLLTDNFGNKYAQTPISLVAGGTLTVNQDNALRPGQTGAKDLLFAPPLDHIEYLRLELPATGFGGTDALRFMIPRDMIAGLSEEQKPPAAPAVP